jgi:hypothetical protein
MQAIERRPLVPIRFRSFAIEQELRRTCQTHGISFDYIAERISEDFFLIEPGGEELHRVEIGRDRLLESPSRGLEAMFHAYVSGTSYSRGNPLKQDSREILEGVVIE